MSNTDASAAYGGPSPTGGPSVTGVLLAQRPPQSHTVSDGNRNSRNNNPRGIFLAGSRLSGQERVDPRGYDPVQKEKMTTQQSGQKARITSEALQRHKQWLRQLQHQRKALLMEQDMLRQRQEQRRKQFSEKAMQFYASVTSETNNSPLEKDSHTNGKEKQETESKLVEQTETHPIQTQTARTASKRVARPAWARSEAQELEQTKHEADDVLSFITNLDFERDMADLDDKVSQVSIQQRLDEIEKETRNKHAIAKRLEVAEKDQWEYETVYLNPEEVTEITKTQARDGWEWVEEGEDTNDTNDSAMPDETTKVDTTRKYCRRRRKVNTNHPPLERIHKKLEDEIDETASIAQTAMTSASIRTIHSKQSIHRLIDKARQERINANMNAATVGQPQPMTHPVFQPPRISVVDEKAGALDYKKSLVNQLPYQHRNPAI